MRTDISIAEAFKAQRFPLLWTSLFGDVYTVIGISLALGKSYDLTLTEPLIDHDGDAFLACVSEDEILSEVAQ